MLRPLFCLSLVALALPACNEASQGQMVNTSRVDSARDGPSRTVDDAESNLQNTASPVVPQVQGFINGVASSDAYEIATSKTALNNARSADVKRFARRMIVEHEASTARLKKIALGLATAPDAALSADQQKAWEQLRTQTGGNFDRIYLDLQRTGHERALASLKEFAAKGEQPQLNAFANDMIPIVGGHLTMLRNMKP